MANLLGANIGANYQGILNLGTTINTPLDSTPVPVTDGMGNASILNLGTTSVGIGSTTTSYPLEVFSSTTGQINLEGGGSRVGIMNSGNWLASFQGPYYYQFGPLLMNQAFNTITFSGQNLFFGNINSGFLPVLQPSGDFRSSLIYDNNTTIGIGSTSVDASAKLDVISTTQGILFPRMTTTQKNAISSPAAGLVVYDTTLGKLCVRGASAWQTITSV